VIARTKSTPSGTGTDPAFSFASPGSPKAAAANRTINPRRVLNTTVFLDPLLLSAITNRIVRDGSHAKALRRKREKALCAFAPLREIVAVE
jgi:hypothetical protein